MKIFKDYKAFTEDGGISKKVSTIFLNPNFHSVCLFRLSSLFYRMHLSPIAKIVWYFNRLIFNVDIDYRANLAGGFVLVHGLGTVIGKEVISEGKLKVYQNVTLGGGNGRPGRKDNDGIVRGQPLFEKNCTVYTGSIVVGGIRIKENAVIKAGSVVSRDVL